MHPQTAKMHSANDCAPERQTSKDTSGCCLYYLCPRVSSHAQAAVQDTTHNGRPERAPMSKGQRQPSRTSHLERPGGAKLHLLHPLSEQQQEPLLVRARQRPASLPLTAAAAAGRATGAARRWSTPAARRTTSCTAPTPTQSGHPWMTHPPGGAPGTNRRPRGGTNRRPRGGGPLTPGVERAPAAELPSTRQGQLQHGRDSARRLRAGGEAAPHRDARSRGERQLGSAQAPLVDAPQQGRRWPETPISAARRWAPARALSGARGRHRVPPV